MASAAGCGHLGLEPMMSEAVERLTQLETEVHRIRCCGAESLNCDDRCISPRPS